MGKKTKTVMSLLLCLMVTLSMCLTYTDDAYAGDGSDNLLTQLLTTQTNAKTLNNGNHFYVANINKKSSYADYMTPAVGKNSNATYTYYADVPAAGTLMLKYISSSGSDISTYVEVPDLKAARYDDHVINKDKYTVASYYAPSKCSVKVTVKVYAHKYEGKGYLAAYYAPASKKLSYKTSSYLMGSMGIGAVTKCTVSVPKAGYLTVKAVNGYTSGRSISITANGFKRYEYLSKGETNIGVKPGKYVISMKGAPAYNVGFSFHPVKETSRKTSRKKAAMLRKKKVNRGIIPANNTKVVHWYKIKNTKKQILELRLDGRRMSGGGSGKLKITVYYPKGGKKDAYHVPGTVDTYRITSESDVTKKARKGTYYVKIESKEGANGYYTLKWR